MMTGCKPDTFMYEAGAVIRLDVAGSSIGARLTIRYHRRFAVSNPFLGNRAPLTDLKNLIPQPLVRPVTLD